MTDLTDMLWEVIKPFMPEHASGPDGRDRPRVDDRHVMNGIFSIMRTGAAWQDVPNRHPPGPAGYCRFHEVRHAPQAEDPGWATASSVPVTLDDRALECLATERPPRTRALRPGGPSIPRPRPAGCYSNVDATILLKWLLLSHNQRKVLVGKLLQLVGANVAETRGGARTRMTRSPLVCRNADTAAARARNLVQRRATQRNRHRLRRATVVRQRTEVRIGVVHRVIDNRETARRARVDVIAAIHKRGSSDGLAT